MPNTRSAKKAVRSSARKRTQNLFWKGRVKRASKTLDNTLSDKKGEGSVLNGQLSALQKVLDKASKNNVISKNKANRLKSKYARKITSSLGKTPKSTKTSSETKTPKSK